MNKSVIINPKSLKGNDVLDRIKSLMNINESARDIKNSVVEIAKLSSDGKVYGIVRENHKYYIKITNKTENLVAEDFAYIGGLKNKTSEVYPSYAKALKQLNLKFKSIDEAHEVHVKHHIAKDDGLLAEHHPYKADATLSATKGIGSSDEYIVDKKGKELSYKNASKKAEDGITGDNVAEKKVDDEFEEVKLTEDESFIDSMITGEEPKSIKETNKGFSIGRSIEKIDTIIESLSNPTKVNRIIEDMNSLTTEEKIKLYNALQKKK